MRRCRGYCYLIIRYGTAVKHFIDQWASCASPELSLAASAFSSRCTCAYTRAFPAAVSVSHSLRLRLSLSVAHPLSPQLAEHWPTARQGGYKAWVFCRAAGAGASRRVCRDYLVFARVGGSVNARQLVDAHTPRVVARHHNVRRRREAHAPGYHRLARLLSTSASRESPRTSWCLPRGKQGRQGRRGGASSGVEEARGARWVGWGCEAEPG